MLGLAIIVGTLLGLLFGFGFFRELLAFAVCDWCWWAVGALAFCFCVCCIMQFSVCVLTSDFGVCYFGLEVLQVWVVVFAVPVVSDFVIRSLLFRFELRFAGVVWCYLVVGFWVYGV